jgi:hypothetical protein
MIARKITLSLLMVVIGSCAVEPPTVIPNGGPLCVSGTYWTRGDTGDNFMHPGRACISCHSGRHRGPALSVAGTLYSAYHEENECNGNGGGEALAQRTYIQITDASGVPFVIFPNRVGNFFTTHTFRFPLRDARVVGPSGRELVMSFPPPTGDCNSCHTREGADGAPGRLVAPDLQRR